MTVYVVAGPNGSGKSTILPTLIKERHLEAVEYICPDIYASDLFSDETDLCRRYRLAMAFAEYKRKRLLNEQKPMIIETVLSGSDKLDFLKEAVAAGYRIISVFVGTDSPQINIQRVAKRVTQGGHDVPEEKIRARYERSMQNLKELEKISDELYIYDNSEKPRLVATILNGVRYSVEDIPEWTKRFVFE